MMRFLLNNWLALGIVLFFFACSQKITYPTYFEGRNTIEQLPLLNDSTLYLSDISTDPEYGRIVEKPIFLGVIDVYESGDNRQKYLNALAGPNGETLIFKRFKSCCPFRTINSRTVGADQKFGLLDIWVVSYTGLNKPDTLYVNAYDQGELIAPKGFTIKK